LENFNSGFDLRFNAAVNLSTCQYRFVTTGSIQGEVIGTEGASNPAPMGVLQNAPTAACWATVRVFGRTTIIAYPAACDLLESHYITANGCGAACKSGSLGIALGRWLGASLASGGSTATGTAMINCITPTACLVAAS